MKYTSLFLVALLFCISACVERGKPIDEKKEQQTVKTNAKLVEHYICNNGHKGSDRSGICPECNTAFVHNQAFHGLNIPQNTIKDPFENATNSNASQAPAQNAFGDYHYICPNGHSGGAASAGSCPTCQAKLTHNQLYHK